MLILHELTDSPTLSSHNLHQWPPPAFGCETAVCCTHDSKHLGRGKSCTPEALILNVQVFPLVKGPHLGKSLFQEKTTVYYVTPLLAQRSSQRQKLGCAPIEISAAGKSTRNPLSEAWLSLDVYGSTIVSVMNKAISTGPRERH
jgi:hypothetical protein